MVTIGTRAWDQEHEKTFREVKPSHSLKNLKEPVYLSIDVDAFDPAYAPDTGFPEPEGMTPTEVFKAIDQVFKSNVIGMDITEVNSPRLNNVTSNLAARTIVRALCHLK